MKIVTAALLVVVFVIAYLLGSFFPLEDSQEDAAADRLVIAAWHLEPLYVALERMDAGDIDGAKDSLRTSVFGMVTGMTMICTTEGPLGLSEEYQRVVIENVARSKSTLNEYISKGIAPGVKDFLDNPAGCFK
ncbi:MAG: hypothetical protein EP312_01215 [Gammaproteobacteria bacterium]|nr:MAG: hypothetical protein EP312_01215 [Gammaproteobacteria bacterium]